MESTTWVSSWSAVTRTFALLLAMAAAGCGSSGVVTIHGAGATFPETIYKRWFREFYGVDSTVRVSYQGLGSGAGIKQFTAGLIDFGASDAAMSEDEIREVPAWGVQLLPMTAGAVVLTYNLPGVPNHLKLSRVAYTQIFLGQATYWDDPRITAANPGLTLPHLPITVVRRADGSGTTFVFTSHLSAVSPEWRKGPGAGKAVSWPVGIGAKGNPGVAFTIDQTPGAIGYLEYSFTMHSDLKTAAVENQAGRFVVPSVESARTALATANFDANLIAWVPDPEGPDSYPIVTYTWMLCRRVYEKPEVGHAIKRMLRFAVTDGQNCSADLGYVPLPDSVAVQVRAAIDRIEVQGQPNPSALQAEIPERTKLSHH